jgi:chemotaxis protein CheD
VSQILANVKRHVVGVADMKLAKGAGNLLVTHALGSCIGMTLYDPATQIGGMLHFMLPDASVNPSRAEGNPWMFADTGIPLFLDKIQKVGALKSRLIVKVAGGAQFVDHKDFFAIGKRNYTAMRKILWKEGLLCKGENVGGTISRTMHLDLGTGRVWFTNAGQEVEI